MTVNRGVFLVCNQFLIAGTTRKEGGERRNSGCPRLHGAFQGEQKQHLSHMSLKNVNKSGSFSVTKIT